MHLGLGDDYKAGFLQHAATESISYSFLDELLVHRMVTSSSKFTGIHLHIWVKDPL